MHPLPNLTTPISTAEGVEGDRKSTRLNSSHLVISHAVFCLKKNKDLRVVLGLLNGVRVIGPARGERRVALLFEQLAPVVPAAREEPEAVHEHDRLPSLGAGA